MGILFYNIFLFLYRLSVRISSSFNPKAAKWMAGRKGIFTRLKDAIPQDAKVIWIHCSSLGEFEQGRPVLEKLKTQYKEHKILLTFFSPSGYEIRKDYPGANWVFYLPMGSQSNAQKFLDIVHPSLVVFVKYEYWYYYLKTIHERKIPLLLISAIFRKGSVFFKWYGSLYRKMLAFFDHIFVQTVDSKNLLSELGLHEKCSISGDTRFDRVIEIAEKFEPIAEIENFLKGEKCIVAGSTWKEDEEALSKLDHGNKGFRLILAPHEISESHISDTKKIFPGSILYSEIRAGKALTGAHNTLIIDSIGLLSRLYHYATLTYIGGGFKSSGIHNTLEAAVYGKPVLFGPNYQKFNEAVELIQTGGGISFSNATELNERVSSLLKNADEYQRACKSSEEYVKSKKGATESIIRFIHEKRLLIN